MAQNKLELPSTLIVGGAEDKVWVRAGDIALRWLLAGKKLGGAFRCRFAAAVDVRDGQVESREW